MTEVGTLLRGWREHRRMSQLELACAAEVSTRHLSYVETGRSRPSRDWVLHLAEHLDVPLRARNDLLLAAGYAPVYGETDLDAPEMAPVRDAIDLVLGHHEPFPAVVVDRHWDLVRVNSGIALLVEDVDPALLTNALRATLHPDGLAPRIEDLAAYSSHVLQRLRRQAAMSGDPALLALHDELAGYPGVVTSASLAEPGVVLPLRVRTSLGTLSFFTTAATFGTAADVTPAELTIEQFFPADAETAELVSGAVRSGRRAGAASPAG